MNILFLSTNDILGGAATVTLRLVEALRLQGVEARMLVGRKDTAHPYVRRVSPLKRMGAKVAERVQVLCADRFRRKGMWKVSTGTFGADPLADPWVIEADAIVLGWFNQGLLSLRGMERLLQSGKPVLWWMHDYWGATGICHLPDGCGRFADGCGDCPYLGSGASARDLSRRVFDIKRHIYAGAEGRLRLLAVSNVQRSAIASSPLAAITGGIGLLPHAFPARLYQTSPAREIFPALRDKKLIVCGAANLDDPMKNMRGAVSALNILADTRPEAADHCHAVFFGETRDKSIFESLRFPATLAGPLDSESLRHLYASAAVVLSPSISETMGATLMEGLAAGAVAVSYDSGGPRDLIYDGNGFIVPLGDELALAEAIAEAIYMEHRQGADGRQRRHDSIAARFDEEVIARQLLSEIAAMR